MDPHNECFIFYETKNCSKSCRSYCDSVRFQKPRMSLLGKPLNMNRGTGARHDMRYQKTQSRIYNFLERPRGRLATRYHTAIFCTVVLCLILTVFSTISQFEEEASTLLIRMEIFVVVWFTIEFFIRLWSSGCRSRYQGYMGRLKFIQRPFCVIDILTIVASITVLAMGTSGQLFAASALRGLRFFQILRMLRMDRRGGTWKLLASVIYAHRQELLTSIYIGFLGLIFTAFLVYLMEKDVNEAYKNFAESLWWGIITLCTIGYGDLYPITWQGKLIASLGALLGCSFFALPAGILGSGFALKVQEQQRQKHIIRRHQPAAILIQAVWRCYAADEESHSIITWKIHQNSIRRPFTEGSINGTKHNGLFTGRLMESMRKQKQHNSGTEDHIVDIPSSVPTRYIQRSLKNNERKYVKEDSIVASPFLKKETENADEIKFVNLTNKHKNAIRFIRKLKYFVARRKFKEALRPYDVKDVMEQYASGHADLLARVKHIHTRLDHIFGGQGTKSKDIYGAKINFATRVMKIENKVADINDKLDKLLKTYMEDRKQLYDSQIPLPIQCDADCDNLKNSHQSNS